MATFRRPIDCRYGSKCKNLHKWISNGKIGNIPCAFTHSQNQIKEVEEKQDLSIGCLHCSASSPNRRSTYLDQVQHTPNDKCRLPRCPEGDKCWMLKFVQGSNGKPESRKLDGCISHCLEYAHTVSGPSWCYYKINNLIDTYDFTKSITPSDGFVCSICHEEKNTDVCMISCNHEYHSECIRKWIGYSDRECASTCPTCREVIEKIPLDGSPEIKAIISRPDFSIMYTEEKKPVHAFPMTYDLYDFNLKKWNAGLFHLLGHICNKCDYETFEMALSCRGCKLDAYTLMECIKKGDIRYLELIGKDKFAEHPTLRLPLRLRDWRFHESKDLIVYETAKTIVNAESYNPLCRELLATWGLEFV